MGDIRQFYKAYQGHVVYLLTGTLLAIALGVGEKLAERKLAPTWVIWLLILAGFVIGAFKTWRKEYRLRVRIQKQLIGYCLREKFAGAVAVIDAPTLARFALCSEKEVMPVLEELVKEHKLTRDIGAEAWTYSGAAFFFLPMPKPPWSNS